MPYYVVNFSSNQVISIRESSAWDVHEVIHTHPSGLILCATIQAVDMKEARIIAEQLANEYRNKMIDKDK